MAHTASLAGAIEAFDAVAADLGVMRADTLDDAVEISRATGPYRRAGRPAPRRHHAVGRVPRPAVTTPPSATACNFQRSPTTTLAKLNAILGVGSLVSNPIDGGFGVLTSDDNYKASIAALQADPNIDMILMQENLPREPGSDRAERYIAHGRSASSRWRAESRSPFITPVSHSQTRLQPRAAGARRRMSRSCRKSTRRCAPSPAWPGATSWNAWHVRRRRPHRRPPRLPQRRACGRWQNRRRRARRGRIKALMRAYGIRDARGDCGAVGRRRREGRAADRLSGGAEGGRGEAAAQIRCRRGCVASGR